MGNVACRDNIVLHLSLGVDGGLYAYLDVTVDVQLGVVHVLAGVEWLLAAREIVAKEAWRVEQACVLEEFLTREVEGAQLAHPVVEVDEVSFLVVERHGHQAIVEELTEFVAELSVFRDLYLASPGILLADGLGPLLQCLTVNQVCHGPDHGRLAVFVPDSPYGLLHDFLGLEG